MDAISECATRKDDNGAQNCAAVTWVNNGYALCDKAGFSTRSQNGSRVWIRTDAPLLPEPEYKEVAASYFHNPSGYCGSDNRARDLPFQGGMCSKWKGCCNTNTGRCGKSAAECDCLGCVNWALADEKCSLDALLKPVDQCSLGSSISLMQDNIMINRLWDVAGAIVAYIPGGDVFYTMY